MPNVRVLRHQAVEHVVVRPEAVLDRIGVDGAVGVVPAYRCCAPAGLVGIGEDGLRAVDRSPLAVVFVTHPQAVVEVVAYTVDDASCQQRRNDLHGVVAGGLGVAEDSAL